MGLRGGGGFERMGSRRLCSQSSFFLGGGGGGGFRLGGGGGGLARGGGGAAASRTAVGGGAADARRGGAGVALGRRRRNGNAASSMSWRRAMSMAGRLAVRGRAGGLDARRAGVGTGSGGPPSSDSSESLQPECRDDGDVAAVPSAATASSIEVLKPRDISACSVQVLVCSVAQVCSLSRSSASRAAPLEASNNAVPAYVFRAQLAVFAPTALDF